MKELKLDFSNSSLIAAKTHITNTTVIPSAMKDTVLIKDGVIYFKSKKNNMSKLKWAKLKDNYKSTNIFVKTGTIGIKRKADIFLFQGSPGHFYVNAKDIIDNVTDLFEYELENNEPQKTLSEIHKYHKEVLNKWKEYRAKSMDYLTDKENERLDKFIIDLAGVLSDINIYIEENKLNKIIDN